MLPTSDSISASETPSSIGDLALRTPLPLRNPVSASETIFRSHPLPQPIRLSQQFHSSEVTLFTIIIVNFNLPMKGGFSVSDGSSRPSVDASDDCSAPEVDRITIATTTGVTESSQLYDSRQSPFDFTLRNYLSMEGLLYCKPHFEQLFKGLFLIETPFTENEVEALYELFEKLSSYLHVDGLIGKDEFLLPLFRDHGQRKLFADRIFDLFDVNRSGHIDFTEFVRSLGVFRPKAPQAEKILSITERTAGGRVTANPIFDPMVGCEIHKRWMIRELCASNLTESADGDFVGLAKIGSEQFEDAMDDWRRHAVFRSNSIWAIQLINGLDSVSWADFFCGLTLSPDF
ncbi:hypothetical protein LXL04_020015 [Taraxacum kok-saghyz]